MSVVEFHSLPGVAGGRLQGSLVSSPTAAVEALRKHRASSAAGDEGAIQVWIDDAGTYRAGLYRYQAEVAGGEFASKAALSRWLKDWWPGIRDAAFRPKAAA